MDRIECIVVGAGVVTLTHTASAVMVQGGEATIPLAHGVQAVQGVVPVQDQVALGAHAALQVEAPAGAMALKPPISLPRPRVTASWIA